MVSVEDEREGRKSTAGWGASESSCGRELAWTATSVAITLPPARGRPRYSTRADADGRARRVRSQVRREQPALVAGAPWHTRAAAASSGPSAGRGAAW